MGLFNRKTAPDPIAKPAAPTTTVNADDIFGAPTIRKPKETVTEYAAVKEGSGDITNEPLNGPASINPEDIKKKMQELEQELAEKSAQPKVDYSQYNLVADDEVADAQEKYEAIYKEEHERYLKSHVQDITEANVEGIDGKVDDMMTEVNAHRASEAAKTYDISQVGDEEMAKSMSGLQQAPKDESKDELYSSITEITAEALDDANTIIREDYDRRENKEIINEIESI